MSEIYSSFPLEKGLDLPSLGPASFDRLSLLLEAQTLLWHDTQQTLMVVGLYYFVAKVALKSLKLG